MAERIRIVLIGAGSTVFAKNVIADMLWHESLREVDIWLVDIDRERLQVAEAMTHIVNRQLGGHATIHATVDRRQALDGANFVICTFNNGGWEATQVDHDIPARFGLKQTIADTLGVGGIFRSIRSLPELLRIADDMEELCPSAMMINYVNPMATHCLALERATSLHYVGLCHGVQNTATNMRMLVALLDEDPGKIERHFERPYYAPERVQEWLEWWQLGEDPELNYTCAGINHMAFFLDFHSGADDLYPALWKVLDTPHLRRFDPVRFALFRRLGYFMTETSGHTAEYVPYFLRDDEEIQKYHITVSSYLDTCRAQDDDYHALRKEIEAGNDVVPTPYKPSNEHVSRIINAAVTGSPYVFNGNVGNQGGALIQNLPADACVEVPCVVNQQGIQPTAVGELPPQCAALIRTNVNVQDLVVRGILEGRRDYIHHAMMVDPNTASQLTLKQIDELATAMFDAYAKWLPDGLK